MNELTARTPSGQSQIDLTYDDAGNLTQDGDSDGDHKYVWDYRNRLIEVQEKQSGTWTAIAEYTYDAKNRRIVKEVTNKGDLNGTTHYIWGAMAVSPGGGVGWQCLQERDGSGDLVAQYTYAPGYIDSPAIQQRDLNGDGDFADSGEKVWYHSNTLHLVYGLTDNAESVVERYRYDAYGAATVLDADGADDSDGLSDVENPYAFTARRLDLESDLMYYRNRQYSVVLGRFISRDAAQYLAALSLYEYVTANPASGTDPLGLVKCTRWTVQAVRASCKDSTGGITGYWCFVVDCRYYRRCYDVDDDGEIDKSTCRREYKVKRINVKNYGIPGGYACAVSVDFDPITGWIPIGKTCFFASTKAWKRAKTACKKAEPGSGGPGLMPAGTGSEARPSASGARGFATCTAMDSYSGGTQ